MTPPLVELPERLRAAASWDVPLVRRAVVTLTVVAERLPAWRARLDGVARSLHAGESWSGPAARSAARAVQELSTVTWAVERALADSRTAFERLAAEADPAQELARAALARADQVPGGLDPGETARALADSALAHAAAVAAAADRAGAALAAVGVRDPIAPADLSALAAWIPVDDPICLLPAPAGSPAEVAAWWAGLPLTTQLAALRADPAGLGGRDGVPAWARDRANRLALAAALTDPGLDPDAAAVARSVARWLAAEEDAGRPVQLQLFDPAGDRVALGLGDLDGADAVAVLVPGINNSPGDDLGRLVGDARAVAGAARRAAPGLTVSVVVWLGYDSPSRVDEIVGRSNAVAGGVALAGSLAGLRAGRAAVAAAAARTTVLAHSYGTVVVDEAADEPGRLAADALVLLGSPGMEDDARGLEAPEVYDAASPDDLIAGLRWFGRSTDSARFGSTALPVDPGTGHSDYYDPDLPTLSAMGRVVTGVPDPR